MNGNSSKTRRRYGDAGFTLVELVVVIAVLAILAGVGAVAYNGYIDYANKGVDRATVGEIIHALELADYSDPTLFGSKPQGMIILSSEGVVGTTTATQQALDDAGLNSTLQYGKWDNAPDAASVKSIIFAKIKEELSYVGDTAQNGGTVKIGYADVASDCWDAVKQTAELLAKREGFDSTGDLNEEAVMLVMEAAMKAEGHTPEYEWSNFNPTYDGSTLGSALPSYLARNYAFANYLEKNYNYDGIEDDLAELRSVENLMEHPMSPTDFLTDNSGKSQQFKDAAQAYLNTTVIYNDGKELKQADIDCEAYYTFMEGMYAKYSGNLETFEEQDPSYPEDPSKKVTRYKYTGDVNNFWTDAGGYIATAAQLAAMTQSERDDLMESLPDEGSVVTVVVNGRNADGSLNITTNPPEIKPVASSGSTEGCTHEHSPESIEVNITQDSECNVTLCLTAGVTSCTLHAKNSAGSSSFDCTDKISEWNSSQSYVTFEGGGEYITITAIAAGNTSIDFAVGRTSMTINITVNE